MIRFSCPTCRKVLKSPDHGVGRKTFCPRCGQRLLIPSPIPIQVQNKTILGQPTPDSAASFIAPSAPSQLPPELSDLDSIATLGLRKDAASEGEVQQQQSYSLARSRAGTVFAALAIMLGIAAVPVSIASDQVYGPALAGLGVLLGILGMFTAVLCGRGSGFGLSLVVTAVCASALWGVLRLISSEGNLNDDILDRLLTSSAPDSEMMEYLPSNCQIIVCVRPGRVAGSEAFRELSRRFPEIGRLETDVEETIGLPPSGL